MKTGSEAKQRGDEASFGRLAPLTRRGLLAGAAGLGFAAAGASAGEVPARRFFRIASGSTAGLYYPLASLIASAISNPTDGRGCDMEDVCGVPGLVAVAQTSAGSYQNLQLLLSRQVESAFCQADLAQRCAEGELDGLPQELGRRLRAIAYLFPEYLQLVVRRGAGIRILADLTGKRVSLGAMGSGTQRDSAAVLRAFGVNDATVQVKSLSDVAAAQAVRDGTLDAFLLIGGVPANAIRSLASDYLIELLPFEGVAAHRVEEMRPPFRTATIQSGLYDHIPLTPTLSVGALWLVAEDLPADLVYEITRSLWSEASEAYMAENAPPLAPRVSLQTALTDIGMPPLHPGAALYYQEIDLLKG